MSLHYSCVHDFYKHLHELQPPAHAWHQHDMTQNAGAAPSYELTQDSGGGAALGGAAGCDPRTLHADTPHSSNHDPRKRKSGQFSDEYELPPPQPSPLLQPAVGALRKRKAPSFSSSSIYGDDGDDSKSTTSRTCPDKKQNHSEIEKRRRDKMNNYITELSSLVPMCGAMARKLDKLTVLRMAVQHLHSVRGALSAGPLSARPRPALLSEKALNSLILQAAHDCFLLVVGCDRGRLLYVSESVKKKLHYDQTELVGHSLFDILHPKDVAKVKEQLSSSDLSPRERLIDAKTMLPVKADVVAGASRLCTGARRSFFCRIKCKVAAEEVSTPVKEEAELANKRKKQNEKKYCVMQCTGYLKSWGPAEMSPDGTVLESAEEGDASNMSCLVAVGRALPDLAPATTPQPPRPTPPATRHIQFVSRHATDGKFLFVDQRVTLALGFLPQELLGTSMYEYVDAAELGAVARTHKAALLTKDAMHTPPYAFRKKDGTKATVQTHFKPFRNPWTKDVECLVANNTLVTSNFSPSTDPGQEYEMFKNMEAARSRPGQNTLVSEPDVEMQRLIDSQVESHKIGSAIAEEALRRSSADFSPEVPADLLQDVGFNQHTSIVEILGLDLDNLCEVRNNVPLSSAGAQNTPPPDSDPPTMNPPSVSPPLPPIGDDGNGEATMAVIMSLLEADAGLGGPVNISGLPWPLP